MDSQPSGNKDVILVWVKTKELEITIKGKYKKTLFDYPEDFFENNAMAFCKNKSELIDYKSYGDNAIFYEHENYEVIVRVLSKDRTVEFYHESMFIREKIDYIDDKKDLMSGIINFRNEIGYSDLVFNINGEEYLKLKIEVFPKKLDYKDDYYNILQDVNNEIYNLSFEFLRRTYLGMALNNEENNSLTEYFSILNYIYDNLIRNIKIVMRSPHHTLFKNNEMKDFHKLKKIDSSMIKWMSKNPKYLVRNNGKILPIKAQQTNKYITNNTYENQFLRYIITTIIVKLKAISKNYNLLQRKKDDVLIDRLNNMVRELTNIIKQSFLNEVDDCVQRSEIPLTFQMSASYKDIYKYYLMLKKGLNIQSDVFKLSMKDLSVLYEYWCFIKLNSILKKKYKLVSSDIIKINTNGIFVSLKKGKTARVTYENPKNKERFTISYNEKMKYKTVAQKPDNVLTVTKEGNNEVRYNYVFDAKYKIDYAQKGTYYGDKYKTPGPVEEDINTMHRYRDAIINENDDKYEREVFGAFVLFPYDNEEEYRENYFYKTIETVNIGAFPLLPSSTKLLEEFLDELIKESAYSSFERSLGQSGKEEYLKEEYFNKREILVGSLSDYNQLETCLKNKFYHTKAKNINLSKNNISTIAIAQSKRLFKDDAGVRYYGKVKKIDIISRNKIREIPKNSEEIYIRFEIEEWFELKEPIRVKGFQTRGIMYTTKFLLNNAKTVSELGIKTESQFRIWTEFTRIYKNIETIDKKSHIQGFQINDSDVYVKDDIIKIITSDAEVIERNLEEFKSSPKKLISEIENLIANN